MTTAQLFARLWLDRFSTGPGEGDIAYRQGWNDHAGHVVRIVLELDRAEHDPGDEDFHR